jgi:CubicO group peptidase (beta-lactamase class C family)
MVAKRYSCFAFFLITLIASQVFASNASLDATLKSIQAKSIYPGFCVAVVDANGIRYASGFGYADLATKRPYTADSVQMVASVSKTVIAAALMQSVERGDLQLDEDVSEAVGFKVRNPRFPDTPITLRQLATHTSSIIDRQPFYKSLNFNGAQRAFDIRDLLRSYLVPGGTLYSPDNFSAHAPGAAFEYTNLGATLIALAVETKAHTTYANYTLAHVLRPLHMDESSWSSDNARSSLATLYDKNRQPITPYTFPDYPDGGLFTSCRDLGKFLSAMLGGFQGRNGILSARSFHILFSPQIDPKHTKLEEGGYNAGILWQLTPFGSIGHPGRMPGVATLIAFEPSGGYGRVMIFNMTNTGEDQQAARDEQNAVWGALDDYGRALNAAKP